MGFVTVYGLNDMRVFAYKGVKIQLNIPLHQMLTNLETARKKDEGKSGNIANSSAPIPPYNNQASLLVVMAHFSSFQIG